MVACSPHCFPKVRAPIKEAAKASLALKASLRDAAFRTASRHPRGLRRLTFRAQLREETSVVSATLVDAIEVVRHSSRL